MIQSIQKIIKIGSSAGVTIPAKTLKQENVAVGDEVEVTIRTVHSPNSSQSEVTNAARKILKKYKTDFKNLSQR